MAFSEFERYQYLIEDFLLKEAVEFKSSYDKDKISEIAKEAGEFSNEYEIYLTDSFFESQMELAILFPHNFRASFLIQIISFVEHELKKICEYHLALTNASFSFDLRDELENAKKYLTKHVGIRIEDLNPEWGVIKNFKTIRNVIVHGNGKVKKSDKRWEEVNNFTRLRGAIKSEEHIFKSVQSIESSELTIILTGKEVNEELLKTAKSFFKKLLEDELKFNK